MTTLAQFQGSEMSPVLLQDFIDGYIRLSQLAVEPSVLVMTVGSKPRRSQIKFYGVLIEDSSTGGPSAISVRMEYLFAFQS